MVNQQVDGVDFGTQRLVGKVALITGASGGQGFAEAQIFAREGARVVLTDVAPPPESLLRELGARGCIVQHDVSEEVAWIKVLDTAMTTFGRLDVLVNNAGIYRPQSMLHTDTSLWELHYRVNQLGVFLGMRAVAPVMIKQGGGSIINVSSNAALRHEPGMFAYATTKWAVRGMSKLAASELAPHHIRVNSIHPGLIDTPMIGANSPAQLEIYAAMIPARRIGTPLEVAELALFLASDASCYIIGAEITVDGGIG